MANEYIHIEKSSPLRGEVTLTGAKNAVLVIMASTVLNAGKNILTNVPFSADVDHMIALLSSLGATVIKDETAGTVEIDTRSIEGTSVGAGITKKMRASILILGPLLARRKVAHIAMPGGCVLGARPIDYHLRAFAHMGAVITSHADSIEVHMDNPIAADHVLEYPSVGATENILMAACLVPGSTRIINAALEPEVFDLIAVLQKMGARIAIKAPATIEIVGVSSLKPVEHNIMPDRLEAGSFLLAAAITGGELFIPHAPYDQMQVFIAKLQEMGHEVRTMHEGLQLKATASPRAVSFKTMPYPGFPTDLQAPMMAALCLSNGTSTVHETVFENRLVHVRELQKMGAQIAVEGHVATIVGVDELYGASVIAPDIRAGWALLLAGLVANGQTILTGVHHLHRGYHNFIDKLTALGANVRIFTQDQAL